MSKDDFFNVLKDRGFSVSQDSGMPVVMCACGEMKEMVRIIRNICMDEGYDGSFSIRQGEVSTDGTHCSMDMADSGAERAEHASALDYEPGNMFDLLNMAQYEES